MSVTCKMDKCLFFTVGKIKKKAITTFWEKKFSFDFGFEARNPPFIDFEKKPKKNRTNEMKREVVISHIYLFDFGHNLNKHGMIPNFR